MTILIIEDEPSDALQLSRAIQQTATAPTVTILTRAEEAVNYLTGAGEYADRSRFPLPALIILDLRLPGMGGLEFLSWLQTQPSLAWIPVVVLSESPYGRDVSSAYQRGARTFFTKPEGAELGRLAQAIVLYWSASLNRTPSGGEEHGDNPALR